MVDWSEMMAEDLRLGVLRRMVDRVSSRIMDGGLNREEAQREIDRTRRKAELLIPDMMDKYDLIYASRFRRLVEQFIIEREAQSRNADD